MPGGRRRGRQPVAAALEGVGGQRDPARTGEYPLPVNSDAAHMQLGQRGQHPFQRPLAPPRRRHHGHRHAGVLGRLQDRLRQHRMRAHLDECPVPLLQQGTCRRLETHRLAQVGVPVPGVHDGAVQPLPGHRRAQRHVRHLRPDLQLGQQPLLDLLDMSTVRRVIHGHPAGPQPLGGQLGHELVNGVIVSGHDDRPGPVHGGHRQPPVPAGKPLLDFIDREPDGRHPPRPASTISA